MSNYAIYKPTGKAGEYSEYACNFYTGCSNGCSYCYCKNILRGIWTNKPRLKKCFIDEDHANTIFIKEMKENLIELRKHGLFFSFTTDPLLPETKDLTIQAVELCLYYKIPVTVLTKCVDWIIDFNSDYFKGCEKEVTFGYTLTGCDASEPKSAKNIERIVAMTKLHNAGFKTFGSFEPVIDFYNSWSMMKLSYGCCDLFKIGLLSGKKYDKALLLNFMGNVHNLIHDKPIYWKDSLLLQAGIDRKDLPKNCVTKDFKL